MRILITGANGLLGQHLIRVFGKEGHREILASSKGISRLNQAELCTYISLDFSKENEVRDLMNRFRPEVILHAGAMTQVDDCETLREPCWQTNVEGTRYLIRNARKYGSYFLFLSTDFIFDGKDGPYRETDLPNPLSFYGLSKLAAEMLLMECGLDWSILRTVLVYGVAADLNRSNIILWVKRNLEQGKSIQVVHDQWRTPTLVEDLAEGCRLAVEKRAHGIFHIAGRDMLTPYQMALQTASFFGLDASLIRQTDSATFTQKAQRPPRTGLLIDKARRVLGYEPHSFAEGLGILAAALPDSPGNQAPIKPES